MAFLLLPKLQGPVLFPLNGARLTFLRHLFSYFLLWSCSVSVPFSALGVSPTDNWKGVNPLWPRFPSPTRAEDGKARSGGLQAAPEGRTPSTRPGALRLQTWLHSGGKAAQAEAAVLQGRCWRLTRVQSHPMVLSLSRQDVQPGGNLGKPWVQPPI